MGFLQVNGYEFAVLSLFLLVDEVQDGDILQKSGSRGHQEVFHGDTCIHEGQWDSIKGCRSVAAIRLENEDVKVNLAPWILLQHDHLLKDWFENATELFHLLVFLDVCFVLHCTEICLEESDVENSFVLARLPTKCLTSSPLIDLVNYMMKH